MSYFVCPNCGEKYNIFLGEDSEVLAAKYGIERVIKIPIDLKLAKYADRGRIEDYDIDYFENFDF
jgi:Mrp family chromosome partitioning ATPase